MYFQATSLEMFIRKRKLKFLQDFVHFTFSKTSDEKDEMLANLNTRVRLFSFLLLML